MAVPRSFLFVGIFLFAVAAFADEETAHDGYAFTLFADGGRSVQTWHGQATLRSIHFEWSRPFAWKTQFGLEFAPYSIRQPRSWFGDLYHNGDENVSAIEFGATWRKMFRPSASIRPWAEIGTGPMISLYPVPAATSFFNMATHGGAGIVLMGSRDIGLYIGYRFTHVSNGGLSSRNPGLNVNGIVIGTRISEP